MYNAGNAVLLTPRALNTQSAEGLKCLRTIVSLIQKSAAYARLENQASNFIVARTMGMILLMVIAAIALIKSALNGRKITERRNSNTCVSCDSAILKDIEPTTRSAIKDQRYAKLLDAGERPILNYSGSIGPQEGLGALAPLDSLHQKTLSASEPVSRTGVLPAREFSRNHTLITSYRLLKAARTIHRISSCFALLVTTARAIQIRSSSCKDRDTFYRLTPSGLAMVMTALGAVHA